MLVVMGDRHIEIKTGSVIRNIISDSLLKKIIDETIIPQFKEDNFSRGVLLEAQSYTTIKDSDTIGYGSYSNFSSGSDLGDAGGGGGGDW